MIDDTAATPVVSVLMPVRNGERFVDEAIKSILAQTFTDWELVIVENGSTDGTLGIVQRYADEDDRIRVLVVGEIGLVAALNRAVGSARGRFVARMDADDVADPRRLQIQTSFLERHSEAVMVGGGYRYIDENGIVVGRRRVVTSPRSIQAEAYFGNPIGHPTVMIAPERLTGDLLYSADYPDAEDFELWLRLMEQGAVYNIREPLLSHRLHPEAATQLSGNSSRESAIAALARHRPMKEAAAVYDATFNASGDVSMTKIGHSVVAIFRANPGVGVAERTSLVIRSLVALARSGWTRLG